MIRASATLFDENPISRRRVKPVANSLTCDKLSDYILGAVDCSILVDFMVTKPSLLYYVLHKRVIVVSAINHTT